MSKPVVAIVGRPNVGKSTLFNRIIKKRKAIIDDQPGITRDRVYGDSTWNGRDFLVVDTGGFIPRSKEQIASLVTQQVHLAIDESDLVLFVLDSKVGPQTVDEEIATLLKKAHKKVIVVANKADSDADLPDTAEFYKLGLGDIRPTSAVSGRDVGDLMDAIVENLPEITESEGESEAINVAIVGRPNVGKSSLFNKIIGENRQIVSEMPGTTRDSIDTMIEIDEQKFNFIDTAGLRRKTHYADVIEFYSSLRSLKAIERANIALVVIDANDGFRGGDVKVVAAAEEEGRNLIFIVNKWDLVKGVEQHSFTKAIYEKAASFRFVPVIFTSALTGKGIEKIIPAIRQINEESRKRIATAELNSFIEGAVSERHPPARAGRFIKFYYATQAETSPPTFIFFCNWPKLLDPPYTRYLENKLRAKFGFEGVPIRLWFKSRRK